MALAKVGTRISLPKVVEQQLNDVKNALDSEKAEHVTRTPRSRDPSLPPSSPDSSDCRIVSKSPRIIEIDSGSDDQPELGVKRKTTMDPPPLPKRTKRSTALQKGKGVDRNPPDASFASQAGPSGPKEEVGVGSTVPISFGNAVIPYTIPGTIPDTIRDMIPNTLRPPRPNASRLEQEANLLECNRQIAMTTMECDSMQVIWHHMLRVASTWTEERESIEQELQELLRSEAQEEEL
jgi:hypothetical protein